ncbi:MAG TPA: redoxin domain-containing protein [Terriglobia bacterium]|nr:redoxin domain-containing protein [Terriglobia bacterium]
MPQLKRIIGKLLVCALIAGAAVPAWGAGLSSPRVQLLDLSGHSVNPLEGANKATVFVFVRTDCPISNRYAPLLHRIHDEYAAKGVAFWLVYVDPRQSAEAIEKHLKEYDFAIGALRDPKHGLVKLTGAQVTPEAAVFVPGNAAKGGESGPQMIYRGRIDDQYVAFGVTRPAPTTHDLENVLEKVVAGKPLKETTTKAVGCFISDLD